MLVDDPKLDPECVTEFTVPFRRRKQWVVVHLCDVTPDTFYELYGTRWGTFDKGYENPRLGYFGLVRIVARRTRRDMAQHELHHAWIEWLRAKDILITARNEERLVELFDEMTHNFWREYDKLPRAQRAARRMR